MTLGERVIQQSEKRGVWSKALLEASIDREDAIRAARPVQPSTSETLTRCPHCAAWGRRDVCGTCGLQR